MLRISYSHTEALHRWTLCGQLAGPWVQELLALWQYTRQTAPEARAMADLSEVTFIDENGEALLSAMSSAGVEFIAAGVANKDLLENLLSKGEKPMRRLIARSTSPCGESLKHR
jgi:hypothetical protein